MFSLEKVIILKLKLLLEIKGFTTVYNVDGLPTVGFENSIKLVLLNNLMIDYFDGFANEIEGFEKY